MGQKKKMPWKVAHTACSEPEQITEKIVLAFIEKEWSRMLGTTDVEFDQKHALKIIEAFKTCEVMLVWREDEAGIPV